MAYSPACCVPRDVGDRAGSGLEKAITAVQIENDGHTVFNSWSGTAIDRADEPVAWFIAAAFPPSAWMAPGPADLRPLRAFHAKRLGTRLTACQQDASTWVKYWADFRDGPPVHACPTCRSVVAAGTRSAASVTMLYARTGVPS